MFLAWLIWGGLVVIAGMYSTSVVRSNEPELFAKLGSPTLLYTNSKGFSYFYGFILLGDYRSLSTNIDVRRICTITQVGLAIWLAALPVTILIAVVFSI
jgi:hypothetical protein